MPVLARFYGIVIRMYFLQSEHNPPHIHAINGDDTAAIKIRGGEVIDGALPPKALSLVQEWMNGWESIWMICSRYGKRKSSRSFPRLSKEAGHVS